jgi:hypothetical protein
MRGPHSIYAPFVKPDAFIEFFHDGICATLEATTSSKESTSGSSYFWESSKEFTLKVRNPCVAFDTQADTCIYESKQLTLFSAHFKK